MDMVCCMDYGSTYLVSGYALASKVISATSSNPAKSIITATLINTLLTILIMIIGAYAHARTQQDACCDVAPAAPRCACTR